MDYRHEQMADETSALFAIFALIACFLVIRFGFRKSRITGLACMSMVGLVLYLYTTVPAAASAINIIFGVFILIGLLAKVKEIF